MNKRLTASVCVSMTLLAMLATSARAQSPYGDIYNRPTVSPYLNLLNGPGLSGNGLPNYQTLVRPQLEAREIAQQQGQAINNLQQQFRKAQSSGANQPAGRTGHETRYNNYSHYYPGFAGLPRR